MAILGIQSSSITLPICLTLASLVFTAWLFYIWRRIDPEAAVPFSVDTPEQCKPGWKGEILDTPSIHISGSSNIQGYAPSTGQRLGEVQSHSFLDIDRVIATAKQAQPQWGRSSFARRRRVLKTLLKFLFDNQETIVRAACLDSGKTRVDALFGEVLVTASKLEWTIKHGEAALTAERRPGNLLMFYKRNEVRYEPLGVVAALVSWNYPFHNLFGPAIAALFTGNAIVIKPSEQTAWSSVYFTNIIRQALHACGENPDLVQAVCCWRSGSVVLTTRPDIDHLTFIGSRPVAQQIAKNTAEVLTPLCLELGGKDAAIVLDAPDGRAAQDREMERIASIVMRGVFQSAGQNCIGIERVVAMPKAYQKLLELLQPRITALRLGNDLTDDEVDMGAMISDASFSKLETLIAEAVAQGAKLLAGGGRFIHPKHEYGHYFEPTLLVDVTPSMQISQEELFAPICLMMRAETVDDAIAIANNTTYGLGCSVFGPTNTAQARSNLERVTREAKAGMVAVNDFAVYYAVQLPFGGRKGSGYGRFAGAEGLRSLCNIKSVCSDRWPGLIKTSIPAELDYPMSGKSWNMGRGVAEFGFGDNLQRRLTGLTRILGI